MLGGVNDTEIGRIVREKNPWWRIAEGWAEDDPYLRELRDAPYNYEPGALADVRPPGLYVLTGPRRVGKSAEMRRAIERLLANGVAPRQIIYCSCDGFRAQDLRRLFTVGRNATRTVAGPRYWLVDEITAVGPEWSAVIKDLRDDTALREDCVVLTGSSARGLRDATKNLAGRRGGVTDSFRLLLPMGFRDFAVLTGLQGLPDVGTLRPKDLRTQRTREVFDELYYHVDELDAAWADYLRVGGYPRAVTDLLRHGDVQQDFLVDLWDVIRGEVIKTTALTDSQTLDVLNRLAINLCSPVNLSKMAADTGLGSNHVADARIEDLARGYLAWRCYRSDNGRPRTAAQRKVYFMDPLIARLAHARNTTFSEPDATQLAEQQIGLALARSIERERPMSFTEANGVLYERTKTGNEIDFVGPDLGVAFEAKYGQRHWRQEAKTIEANYSAGILATTDIYNTDHPAWAVPASILAWVLG